MKIKEKIRALKDKVEFVLENYPESRNSDKLLTVILWKEFYPQYINRVTIDNISKFSERVIKLSDILFLPSQDGIKRVRAHIQNHQRRYPPTSSKVAKERGWQEHIWRQTLGYHLPNKNQMTIF